MQGAVTNSGALTIGAGVTLADGGFTLTAKGALSNAGTHSGAGKIVLAATANQTLSGTGSYGNLQLTNALDATLINSPSVSGLLTFSSGKIITGTNSVVFTATGTTSGANSNNFVNGNVRKTFATGSGQSFIFPIGDGSKYRPSSLTNLNVTTAGSLTASVTASSGNHPQIAASGINPSKDVPRWWTLTAADGLVVANYDAKFTFVPSDISGGANTSYFDIRKWSGSSWSETGDGIPAATSTTATGLNSFSDFIIGEPLASKMMVTLPGQTFTSGSGNADTVSNQIAGAAFNITLSAVGIFTNLDLSYTGLKTISYSGPNNAPSGSAPVYTAGVTFSNGQATVVATTLMKAETASISATDDLLTGVPSASLLVLPAAASQLAFTNSSLVITSGVVSATLTVQRRDPYGNPNTADASRAVTLASSSSGTTAFSPASPLSITSGVSTASFTYTDTKAGTPTLTAASTSPTTITSATQQETVSAGPVSASASTLTASPASVTADGATTSTITVTLKDASGNPIAGKSVSLSHASGAGVPVQTTLVNVTDSNGQGSWTVKSTTAAADVFTAEDSSDNLTVLQTATVTFTAGAMTHYGVTFSSPPFYADTPFTTYVTAKDAYNNTVTTFSSANVSFSSSSANMLWDADNEGSWDNIGSDEIVVTALNGVAAIPTKYGMLTAETNITITASDGTYTGTSTPIDIDIAAGAYRTKASGNWSDFATVWQVYNVSITNWENAVDAPSYSSGVIEIAATHTVTIATDLSVDQLHIGDGGTVIVPNGVVLTVVSNTTSGIEVHGSLTNNGVATVNSGAVMSVYDTGVLNNAGTVNSGASYGTLMFYGGTYQHAFTTTAGVIPVATWRSNAQNSTCKIVGYTSNTGTPGGLGQNFLTFIWDCPSQTASISMGSAFQTNNTFTVSSTGTGAGAITLGADLNVASTLTIASGTRLDCGTHVISGGYFDLQNGGTLGIGSADGITASGATGNIRTATRHYSSGANFLYQGTAAQVTGSGLPASVHQLTIADSAGVALSGNVAVNDILTLTSGAFSIAAHTLTLNESVSATGGSLTGGASSDIVIGDAGAVAGTALPAVASGLRNLTINRVSGVTLGGAVTVSGTLTLTLGVVSNANNLTFADASSISRATGTLSGTPAFSGTVNVTYTAGGVTTGTELPASSGNVLQALSFSQGSGAVTLGAAAVANSTITIDTGATLEDGGFVLTAKGNVANAGTYTGTGRILLTGGSATHTLSGGGSYVNLELSDATHGASLTGGAVVSGTLFLTAGTLANGAGGSLTLANGATISRAVGELGVAPTFGTSVNVVYAGVTGVAAGFELPPATTVLNSLTLSYAAPATLTLSASRTVNGNLAIGAFSTLADAGFALTVVGDLYNDGHHSGSGKIELDNPYTQVLFGSGSFGNLALVQGDLDLAGNPTINGTLTLTSGVFDVLDHTLTLNGPIVAGATSNLITTLDSSLVFGGSATGVAIPASVTELNNLTINNANGVTMTGDLHAVGTLTLTSGTLNTGASILHLNNADNNALTRSSGWVNGALCKLFGVGSSQSFTFPVGGASLYRPVTFINMNVPDGGELEFRTIEEAPAHLEASGFNTNKIAKAFWRGIAKGRLQIVNPTGTFNFNAADVPVGADAGGFCLRIWDEASQSWLPMTTTVRTSTSTTATGLDTTVAASSGRYESGDFVLGEPLASKLVVTLPGETFTDGSGNAGSVIPQTAGTPFNIAVRAVDLFNITDANYTGAKTISYSGPENGVFDGTPVYTTSVTFTNGLAVGVATTLKKAESTTLTPADGTLTGDPSSSLTVLGSATASRLVFTTPPVTVLVGIDSSPITVQRQDAYGNPVTAGTLTLTLASDAGGTSTFAPTSPQMLDGSDSATFTYTDTQIGTPTLTASSGALTGATQQATVIARTAIIWDGGGADDDWLTAANWTTDTLPREGDPLVFAGSTRLHAFNNFQSYTIFGGLTFNGPGAFILEGDALALGGSISNSVTATQTINLALNLVTTNILDVVTNGTLVINGLIDGEYGLIKNNTGTLTLTAANSYSGDTAVNGGTLLANTSTGVANGSGTLTVNCGGTLGGYGRTHGALTVQSGGIVAPGASIGTLTVTNGDVTLTEGSTFRVEYGASPECDRLSLSGTGSLILNNATLELVGIPAGTNLTGTSFTIALNATNIVGTFKDTSGNVLTNGAALPAPNSTYFIHYVTNRLDLGYGCYIIIDQSSAPTSSGIDLRAYQGADGVYVEFVAYDVEKDGSVMLSVLGPDGKPVWTGTTNVLAGERYVCRFPVPGLAAGSTYTFAVSDEVGKGWTAPGVTVGAFAAEMVSLSLTGITLSFSSLPDREYEIQWTGRLGADWQTVTNLWSESDHTRVFVTYPDPEAPAGFFRIRVK